MAQPLVPLATIRQPRAKSPWYLGTRVGEKAVSGVAGGMGVWRGGDAASLDAALRRAWFPTGNVLKARSA